MENWFEFSKDRRFVPIFFILLAAAYATLLVFGILFGYSINESLLKYLLPIATLVGAGLLVFVVRGLMRLRAGWRDRYKTSPMSRDEVFKARSKLVK